LIYNEDTLFFSNYNNINSPLEQIKDISYNIRKYKKKYQQSEDIISSDCWRGFFAEWKIIDNTLYLSKVFDCYTNEEINKTIEKVLKQKFINGLLKADWVNGVFWCGKNEDIENYSVYLSAYKYNCRLSFEKGVIVNKEEYGQKENFIEPILSEENDTNEDKIYKLILVDIPPLFDGKPYAISLIEYLNKNITKYDETNGRVFVKFIIEKDGTISNTEVIRSINPILDAEALRIVNNFPQWTPGKIRDKAVRVEMICPISFKPHYE